MDNLDIQKLFDGKSDRAILRGIVNGYILAINQIRTLTLLGELEFPEVISCAYQAALELADEYGLDRDEIIRPQWMEKYISDYPESIRKEGTE